MRREIALLLSQLSNSGEDALRARPGHSQAAANRSQHVEAQQAIRLIIVEGASNVPRRQID
jgi:hypothetical protein